MGRVMSHESRLGPSCSVERAWKEVSRNSADFLRGGMKRKTFVQKKTQNIGNLSWKLSEHLWSDLYFY